MLKEILKVIDRDRFLSIPMLSKELKVSEALIDEGIFELLRMGYIIKEETGESCSTVCARCPFAKTCNKEIIKTYRITEKGQGIIRTV